MRIDSEVLGETEFYAAINRRVQDRPRNRAKGHHKASKGQCFRLSLYRWLVKRSDSCEKVQEREGICIFCTKMVSAALTPSKIHPLANDRIKSLHIPILSIGTIFIETKFQSCPLFFFLSLLVPRYQRLLIREFRFPYFILNFYIYLFTYFSLFMVG